MTTSTDDHPAAVDEIYQSASNTSNLRVEADRRGPGDVIIAAGWSMSRLGMGLLRLHSEWDASEKPPKPTKASIEALVGTFQRALPGEYAPVLAGNKPRPLTGAEAVHYAARWHAHEVGMLLGKLKALPDVREQVTLKALRWGMGRELFQGASPDNTMPLHPAAERREEVARATGKASAVIRYWLDQTCGACHGLKWQQIPGTPALSAKPCHHCCGSGFGAVPHQEQGKRLANYLDDCVSRARQSLKNRLRAN